MALLRFHWDFFGPDAQRTAEHFLHHVDEFNAREGVTGHRHWTTDHGVRVTATLECDQQHLHLVRDRLRPVRAERVLDE
ncbi:MAG: hypothetical protein RBT71_10270 [Flavobacteriales bacterium]|jgi:hypothetical protein|nr:hypothetical protein [Flavobacteriales bacterium]